MIRAKKMTDKVRLETFWGSHSIFLIIYKKDRAKRFIIIRWFINSE